MNGSSFCAFTAAVLILVLFVHWATLCYSHAFSRRGRNMIYRDFYECGFRTVPDIRSLMDIQFSAVGVIFLIFDMEIVLLTPLLLNAAQLPALNIALTITVLGILGLSYWFEWEKYTIHWSLI